MPITPRNNVHSTTTLLRQIIEANSSVDIDITPHLDVTLNSPSKYNIQPGVLPTQLPQLLYFGIGIGGCYNADDSNVVSAYIPKADEFDLYKPIPFRAVPVDEDLTDAERAMYRMRKRQTIRGQDYFLYYLKCLRLLDTAVKIVRVDPVTKQETPYELLASNLNPTPTIPTTSGTSTSDGTEIQVGVRVAMDITGKEVYEVINVLYEGDLRHARISEYGIYQGQDKQVTGFAGDNTPMNYIEAIYTQLAYKTCTTGSSIESETYSATRVCCIGNGKLLVL